MKTFQKMGGIAALIEAGTFVVGFVLLFTLLAPLAEGNLDPVENVAFLAENQTIIYIWNLIIYVVFGLFLVVLELALFDRLKTDPPILAQIATAYGLIWAGLVIAAGMVANIGTGVVVSLLNTNPAQAGSAWLAIDTVRNGLGGGNEIVGGVWVLLVSLAALQTKRLPKALNIFGIIIGFAGLATIVPPLGEIGGAIFGLGLIVWFIWLGIVMLRSA